MLSSFPEGKNNLPFLFTNTAIMFGDSYTERKIDFVTGHTGSNVWDITQVTLVAPVCRISPTSSAANYRRDVDGDIQLTVITGCCFALGRPPDQTKVFRPLHDIIVVD